ncbi:MAG: BON domain-containing protein [Rhodoferax sp.]|uniref:BON domain-containing protein n=1 Tax=Rhodoferax sp. TaxID=50421 RepID=UPI00262CD29E|nr:BON domain-containing protein [Rhodoferax sp.]MDD5336508.1 BON domain-containing protein [Rhodoferax sp.]
MTTTHNFGKISRHASSLGATLFVSALLLGMNLSQAASDNAAIAPSNAASKAERAVSDSWITTKVKAEILANSVSKAFKVSVKTKRGMVSLKGKLPSQDAIDLVKMIAEKVKGVKSVDVSGLVIGS